MYELNFFLILLTNLPILFFYNFIIKKLNFLTLVMVQENQKRSLPLIGGFLLLYNILIFQIINLNFFLSDINRYFSSTRELFAFYLGLLFCFSGRV